jgi:hypothetical protein
MLDSSSPTEGRDVGPVLDGGSDDFGKQCVARKNLRIQHIVACLDAALEWRR